VRFEEACQNRSGLSALSLIFHIITSFIMREIDRRMVSFFNADCSGLPKWASTDDLVASHTGRRRFFLRPRGALQSALANCGLLQPTLARIAEDCGKVDREISMVTAEADFAK
jgi:hypothetical protein